MIQGREVALAVWYERPVLYSTPEANFSGYNTGVQSPALTVPIGPFTEPACVREKGVRISRWVQRTPEMS